MKDKTYSNLKKGTSDAEKVTVSFYVKGNASATYTVELEDNDNSRFNSQEFSVTTSWTRVTKTFVADTTGTLDDDNAVSLSLKFWLHGGSTYTGGTHTSNTWHTTTNARLSDNQTSFFDSTSRTFFITGIQMEVGEQATPFEHRSFGEELALCQRYYHEQGKVEQGNQFEGFSIANAYGTSAARTQYFLPTTMRAIPTFTATGSFGLVGSSAGSVTGIGLADDGGNPSVGLNIAASSLTVGDAFQLRSASDADATFAFDAEL